MNKFHLANAGMPCGRRNGNRYLLKKDINLCSLLSATAYLYTLYIIMRAYTMLAFTVY